MNHKRREYEICKQRKHQASGQMVGDENGSWQICKFCDTQFQYATVMKERNVPDETE